jgi:hypothetical protein
VREIVVSEGYQIVQRNAVDGGHWPGRAIARRIVSRTLENIYDGAIIAYHLSNAATVRVMPSLLAELLETGCTLVTLSGLPYVSEWPERHPEFANLPVDTGYLQVEQPPARAWSMNLLEYGTRANQEPGTTVTLTETDYGETRLQIGEREEAWQQAASQDRHLLVIAGKIECRFRAEGESVVAVRALAHQQELILWPAGYEMQLVAPDVEQRRWIVLILAAAGGR